MKQETGKGTGPRRLGRAGSVLPRARTPTWDSSCRAKWGAWYR